MAKSVEWSRLVIEGAVIVASILMAFTIEAAWDLRKDLTAEQDLLRALELDMLANLTEIDRVTANHQWASDATDLFLAKSPEELESLPQDSVDLLRGVFGSSSFDPSTGSLSNATLASLHDPALLRELGAWSRQLANERTGGTLMDNAFWEMQTVGGEIAPEHFIDKPSAGSLGTLRASPRFVGLQIAIQSVRAADIQLLSALGTQTDTVLSLVRRNRGGSK